MCLAHLRVMVALGSSSDLYPPSTKPLVTHVCRSAPDEGPDHSRGEERTRLLHGGTVQGDDAP